MTLLKILDLMLHPLLLELEPYAWGWEYSSVDSDYYDGFTAIQRCYKDATKKKLSGGECIIVDFRKPTGDAQYPALAKNYLIEERETRKVIAQNLKKSKKFRGNDESNMCQPTVSESTVLGFMATKII